VLKDDLQNALRASTIFSDKFNQVTITVLPDKEVVTLDTKNAMSGENTYKIHSGVEGEEISLNFNYSYFNDVLSTIKSDSINLLFNGVGKPVVIKDEGHGFLYLIMPMSKS
jgi:DNA polymerase III sliding clamp (beta) subunit (PCNA family)